MEPPSIRANGLTKAFAEVDVLKQVHLDVRGPGVFGFLGVNGAGKTTTLRILAGLLDADGGDASVHGHPAGSLSARRDMGYLPQSPAFYGWMRAEEFLHFTGDLLGLSPSESRRRSSEWLERLGLADAAGRKIHGFSGGMKQRLGLAQALLGDPSLLLLDEPVSALDPVGRQDVLGLISELGLERTVFFSTHILGDVDRICEQVAILHEGSIVVDAPVDELRRAHLRPSFVLSIEGDHQGLADVPGVTRVREAPDPGDGRLRVDVEDPADAARRIPAWVAAQSLGLRHLEEVQPTLEEIFLDIVGER